MARITKKRLEYRSPQRGSRLHDVVDAEYFVFTSGKTKIMQIRTPAQVIQIDQEVAQELASIFRDKGFLPRDSR